MVTLALSVVKLTFLLVILALLVVKLTFSLVNLGLFLVKLTPLLVKGATAVTIMESQLVKLQLAKVKQQHLHSTTVKHSLSGSR